MSASLLAGYRVTQRYEGKGEAKVLIEEVDVRTPDKVAALATLGGLAGLGFLARWLNW